MLPVHRPTTSDVAERRGARKAVVIGLIVVAVLAVPAAVVGLWAAVVIGMSDPAGPSLLGLRIDGDTFTVKAAQCPSERVRRVELRDSDSEKLVWRADGPLTEEGRGGLLRLWAAEEYRTSRPATRPAELPEQLDVSVGYGSEDGVGGFFDLAEVRAAAPPAGSYWTPEGIRTGRELDELLDCGGDEKTP
ncbi:hypothetical protein AQF52_3573 [Streptomyces venezuelae]|uniref:hypothetical protein n=1 Tax=Streptomyces gardneri TaxID=66892 RepID=UPI0006BCB8CA|nr:hypothetical protein [Streptomyces gardneri]ALO09167.1 hypothetical protein AQF52_3573 [Streptomyces venezuelae]QPK46295.1 hypothetical protein H4W23_17785 [Streptomyces gardneri]WRK37675.1 hypothetical protein U0M97_17880 [Streptomyces venezuelae]CUM40431.1 hypothetical protein BN2537_9827 [Streptomyces venezuelae]